MNIIMMIVLIFYLMSRIKNNYDDCVNILLDVANKNNMEQRGLLFGGQKQNLFIKR